MSRYLSNNGFNRRNIFYYTRRLGYELQPVYCFHRHIFCIIIILPSDSITNFVISVCDYRGRIKVLLIKIFVGISSLSFATAIASSSFGIVSIISGMFANTYNLSHVNGNVSFVQFNLRFCVFTCRTNHYFFQHKPPLFVVSLLRDACLTPPRGSSMSPLRLGRERENITVCPALLNVLSNIKRITVSAFNPVVAPFMGLQNI